MYLVFLYPTFHQIGQHDDQGALFLPHHLPERPNSVLTGSYK